MSSHGEKAMIPPGNDSPSSRSLSTLVIARLPPAESPAVTVFAGV